MKKTVHFVHFSAKPGGLEVLLPQIAKQLGNYDFKSFVIRPQGLNELNVYNETNIVITYGSNNSVEAILKFILYVLKNRNDIFHLFNAGPFYLFVLKILFVRRIIYSIHGTIYWKTSFQKLTRKLFWILANSPHIVFISNSEYSAKVFNEKILQSVMVKRIYNPIDLTRFNTDYEKKVTTPELKIVFVGRLVEGKNLFFWIEMAEFLMKSGIKAKFNIYGTGDLYDEINKRINNSKFKEKIMLNGHISKVEEVYKRSDLLLFLSEHESFGSVVIESVLCGVPVITFNIPSMIEIFNEYPEFLIDKDRNIEEQLLQKISQLDKLKEVANKASISFKEKFGTIQHIDQLTEIYRNLEEEA